MFCVKEEKNGFSSDTIIVWHFSIPYQHEWDSILWSFLSQDEKAKSSNFLFARDQKRYIFCRGVLRYFLSLYIGYDPSEIFFQYNEFGKPALAPEMSLSGLKFNLSHTSSEAVFAFAYTEVGIDIEERKPILDILQLAETVFSKEECNYLKEQKSGEQLNIFYELWTKKEAMLKALGLGFGGGGLEILNRLKRIKEKNLISYPINNDASIWSVQELNLPKQCSGALAYMGSDKKVLVVTDLLQN